MSSSPIQILLVEDNPGDARLIQEMLAETAEADFRIERASRLSEGLQKLSQGGVGLVLLDLGLPDSHGLDTFLQAYAQAPQVPFVVLSGLNDETLALSAVREGAQDYLVKGQTDGSMLLRAIRYATERKRIEEDLRRANEALHHEIEVRRFAEMAVEAERQRLYALLDGLPAFVSLISPDFSLQFANREFENLFGVWQGRRCYEMIFGKPEPCQFCPALKVLANRDFDVKEMTVPVNGRIYNIYKYPFIDVDGSTLVLSLGIDITGRKRAEEALEAERRRLYALLDGLPAMVYLKGQDFSIRFANRVFREIFGEQERDKPCYEVLVGRKTPCNPCATLEVFKSGRPNEVEFTDVASQRTFEVHNYPFSDMDGSPVVLTLGVDITQRKQAEEALKESERKYRLLVGTIPAVAFKGYSDWSIEFFDDKIKELTGYGREEFNSHGLKWSDLILKEDLWGAKKAFVRAIKDDGAYLREYRIRTKDGRILWLQARGRIVFTPAGEVDHVTGVFYDISERRAEREALRSTRERLQFLLSATPAVIYSCSLAEGYPTNFISDNVTALLGYRPEEFYVPDFWTDHIHPEDAPRVFADLPGFFERGFHNFEYRFQHKEGGYRWLQTEIRLIKDRMGAPLEVVGYWVDVTERKRVEEALIAGETRYRELFDNMSSGVVVLEDRDDGQDFVFRDINRAAERIEQVRKAHLLGKSVRKVFPGVESSGLWEVFQRVWRTGQPERHPATFYQDKRISGWRENYVYRLPTGEVITVFDDITARKQAELEMERLASFPQLNPDPVLEVNAEGALTYYNDAATQALEDLGLAGEKLFVPADIEEILVLAQEMGERKFYREMVVGGAIFEEKIEFIPQFGVLRIGAADITARKKTEEALKKSQARLAEAQRMARLGNWEWDLPSGEISWSDEVYRIFGLKRDEFTPSLTDAISYFHPDDQQKVLTGFDQAIAGEKPFNLVIRLVRPDGALRYVHFQAEVANDEAGNALRLLGTAQDITERRVAEMRLRESEERFRAIYESSALGIGLADMQGQILTVNNTFERLLDYEEGELLGKDFLSLTHADDVKKTRKLFQELQSGRRDYYQIEKRYLRKGGQPIWARVTVSAVKDQEGMPLYAVSMLEDITQRKQAEEQLHESENRLRILASRLMTAQEDERKRISRELHDELGQALLVLKLQARAVEQGLETEQQELRKECLDILSNLDQVVDNVRRLSRDLSPLILEDLGLSAALKRLIQDFSQRYHIKFEVPETDIDDLFPLAVQVAIYRIFQESLTNIGKHSQADLLTLDINKTPERVAFLIQDNGKGFNQTQRRHEPANGLGLAAMAERVRMVGGTMTIWSRENAGTRISFSIPYSPKQK